MSKLLKITGIVLSVFASAFFIFLTLIFIVGVYYTGFMQGFRYGATKSEVEYNAYISELLSYLKPLPTLAPVVTPEPTNYTPNLGTNYNWGGPDLWEAVNKRRKQLGVNSLNQRDDLCTIASIRLNELLDLDDLDGHEGFSNMTERRPDLAHIFENYSTVAEFLALGGRSPEETVGLWENSLGHKKLLTGGEYVWGCIYAQNTFAVAIAAF